MVIDPVDATYRAQMRALARKGGAVTKGRYGYDPRYYRDIGRLGGHASVAARKAKIAAELDAGKPGEVPIVEAVTSPSATPQASPRPTLSPFKKLLAERGRPSLNAPPARNRWDDFAEEQAARAIAQIRQHDSEDYDEPFDELG
ncbi:MAG TPA: hypothetical protein VFE35_06880 [Candidatus Cybelea sp.]|jgi:general stress protein YciG|nr:hypothetical protein [Candidatus Cybelea sp.]